MIVESTFRPCSLLGLGCLDSTRIETGPSKSVSGCTSFRVDALTTAEFGPNVAFCGFSVKAAGRSQKTNLPPATGRGSKINLGNLSHQHSFDQKFAKQEIAFPICEDVRPRKESIERNGFSIFFVLLTHAET